jgi:hypothetical protein
MTLDLNSPFEVISVTAQYSNAVLVALLPYVNDVATKLDLHVPRPVTVTQVTHCSIKQQRRLGEVGAEIGVNEGGSDAGWSFVFDNGYINTIQGPHSYYTLQDPDEISKYFGRVRMTKAEVVEFARQTIGKLGIPLEVVFAEQEPRVTEPEKVGTNTVPHYRIEWLNPTGLGQAPGCVDMDINADTKRVERIRMFSENLRRPPPKISVAPPSRPVFRDQFNPEYANRLIPIMLSAIDEYGSKLGLLIPRPLTTNHIFKIRCTDNGGWPHCNIELTNGWRFVYRNSMVNGYYAADDLWNSDWRPKLIKQFTGDERITEDEAVELIRRTIRKLGYSTNYLHVDFRPIIQRPVLPHIPRIFICWNVENADDLQSKVEAEVDLDRGEIKSLYHDDKAYWNHAPPIGLPLSVTAKMEMWPQKTIPKHRPVTNWKFPDKEIPK